MKPWLAPHQFINENHGTITLTLLSCVAFSVHAGSILSSDSESSLKPGLVEPFPPFNLMT